jgi:hypothetical protein
MASAFTERLVNTWNIKDPTEKLQTKTSIDLALLKVSSVFGHVKHRDHGHIPDDCRGCAEVQAVIDDLKIK